MYGRRPFNGFIVLKSYYFLPYNTEHFYIREKSNRPNAFFPEHHMVHLREGVHRQRKNQSHPHRHPHVRSSQKKLRSLPMELIMSRISRISAMFSLFFFYFYIFN